MIDYKSEYKVGGCLPQPKDKRDWKFGKYVKPLMAIRLPENFESKRIAIKGFTYFPNFQSLLSLGWGKQPPTLYSDL